MVKGISGTAIAATLGGSLLLFSGLRGKKLSTTVREFISGKQPSGTADPSLAVTVPTIAVGGTTANLSGTGTAGSAASVSVTAGGGTRSQNMAKGALMCAPYGWVPGTQYWTDLVRLWDRESNWNHFADNPTSHAYGIPQALPSTKLPLAGRPASEGGTSSAVAQIGWGLNYIKGRYGNPTVAWAHEVSNNWY